MSKIKNIEKLLAQADAASEVSVEATPEERETIRAYCKLALRCKNTEAQTKQKLAGSKKTITALRKDLLAALRDANTEILAIPKVVRMEAERRGVPSIPPYIRLAKSTKDLTITSEVVQDALASLTDEDIRRAETQSGLEAIAQIVLENVRRNIRSFSENVRLVQSIPRGIRAADIDAADADLSDKALQFHELTHDVSETESSKRETVSLDKELMEQRRRAVESFFDRAEVSHQRVTLENSAYNLCKRISVVKPRLTLKVVEALVTQSLTQIFKGRRLTREQAALALAEKKPDMIRAIKQEVETLPSTSKITIHLQKVNETEEEEE